MTKNRGELFFVAKFFKKCLHRFLQCTLGTSLPNPNSNPFKIGLFFVNIEDYCVHLGHGKNLYRKKPRVGTKKIMFSPKSFFS